MNPFFSKASVNRLEPMLSYMVEKACSRIDEFRESGQPLLLRRLYMVRHRGFPTSKLFPALVSFQVFPVFLSLFMRGNADFKVLTVSHDGHHLAVCSESQLGTSG